MENSFQLNQIKKMNSIRILLCFLIFQGAVYSCNIPVFRYALEKWPGDGYIAIVLSEDELKGEGKQAFDFLMKYSMNESYASNLESYHFTTETLEKSEVLSWFSESPDLSKGPLLFVFPPRSARIKGAVWETPLTLEAVENVLYSPVRNELANEICSGTSGVWVLLESGDAEKDEAAWKVMQEAKVAINEHMVLPEGVVLSDGTVTGDGSIAYDPENELFSDIELKIDFKIKRIRRDADPFFTKTMIDMSDAGELSNEPLVFTLFGRGRALDPMISEGINEDNLYFSAEYLCGACSCEVKSQNPGYDILMLKNWEAAILGEDEEIDFNEFVKVEVLDVPADEGSPDSAKIILLLTGVILLMLVVALGQRKSSL